MTTTRIAETGTEPPAPPPSWGPTPMAGLALADLTVAARTVWGEARNQGYQGMLAVAWVLRNRTEDPHRWPIRLAPVCTQAWQFSCWNRNDPNRAKLLAVGLDDLDFVLAHAAVWAAVAGTLPDPTDGANHYHSRHIEPPYWAEAGLETGTIGDHVFYRL